MSELKYQTEIHIQTFYPTSAVRSCVLHNILTTFVFGKCEFSCASKMQYIHLFITNKSYFLPSHFKDMHFRREKSIGFYLNLSCESDENDIENDDSTLRKY